MGINQRSSSNLLKQAAIWRSKFGDQFELQATNTTLTARGIVRPDPMFRPYDVMFQFDYGHPNVTIMSPDLKIPPDQLADTHMYRSQEPCLFRPHAGDWRPESMRFTVLVTWMQEWIIFHEIWRATGEWLGGGEHPPQQLEGHE